jgi:hypothetical protein
VAPTSSSVTVDDGTVTYGWTNTWTAVGGFGAGYVAKYTYAFDTSATHTWTGSESSWSGSTLKTLPTSVGTWYLHVRGWNGDNIANGTYDAAITVSPKALTVTGITAASTVYDGTTTAKLGGNAALLASEALGAGTTSDGKPYSVDAVSLTSY